jgi:erythromycin esterase
MRRRLAASALGFVALACVPSSELQPNETAWLRGAAVPFSTTDPGASLDDLEPLRALVANTRVVSLGEATHGTREFFQMKHRILRFLVERMGFTAFSIEASMPECERLDRYVRRGEGDPAMALSGQYFWTWNTREVSDMVEWMRAHNEAGGNLAFAGFDMQFPGMAIHNILKFIGVVEAASLPQFIQKLDCMARYANDWTGQYPAGRYDEQPARYREVCRPDLVWVHDTIRDRRADYVTRSSSEIWSYALRQARLTIQYDDRGHAGSHSAVRDAAMAENVLWQLDRLGPRGKMVLWGHNGHVATTAGAMGASLRPVLGADMVVIGFAFARGGFTALGGGAASGRTSHRIEEPRPDSFEYYFQSAGIPRFILDLRNRDLTHPDTAWLAGPKRYLSIGCCWDPDKLDELWHPDGRLAHEFDVMIYIETSTPSQRLPFVAPRSFDF